VDLTYYGNQRQLEYDFELAPGADPSLIKLSFAGAQRMRVAESGDLVLRTRAGEVRQHQPVAYQQSGDARESVAVRYAIRKGQVCFEVADYDATKPLIIDPILSYSTFLGGANSYEVGYSVAVDAAGDAYIVGVTYAGVLGGGSPFSFPVTANAYQSAVGAEGFEAFVSKVSADGSQLLYSSILGGNMEDAAIAVALDSSDNLYVSGYTGSPDFPVTAGCAQATYGGPYDVFVSKFSFASPGVPRLIYSTYLGGSNLEDPHGMALDSSGNIYVTGYTQSFDFPATQHFGNSSYNAFVTKLNAAGSAFTDSVQLGDYATYGYAVAVDSAGNAYVTGQTTTSNFPTTPGSLQTALAGGGSDGFVTKLDYNTRQADLYVNASASPNPVSANMAMNYDFQVWNVVNADGSNFVNLTNNSDYEDNPQWSPDGTKIAFEDYGTGFFPEVVVMNADGTNRINVTNSPTTSDYNAVWSPTGSRLVFSRHNNGDGLYAVNADGSNLAQLTGDASDDYASWSPDGSKIAFVRGSAFDGSPEIYLMNPDGSSQAFLVDKASGNERPDWSSDSGAIAFTTYRTGNREVFVIKTNRSGLSNVSNSSSYEYNPDWQPAAPPPNTPAGGNVSVALSGVNLTFAGVTAAGNTTATPIDPASAGQTPGGYTVDGGGPAYEVQTTASYTAPIQVCFNVSAVNDPATFAALRVLHGEGGVLVDRTILAPDAPAPDFASRTLCARVSSLSPFVIARLTTAPAYSIRALYDVNLAHKSGSTAPIKVQVRRADGTNASAATLSLHAVSLTWVSANTTSRITDSGNANPDNNFRYDAGLSGDGGGYIFNLSTKGLSTGTYMLGFTVGSGSTLYGVPLQVK
jgi:Beta-propeller repeat/WD40-like Beta Propeller Repeat